jgi:two-component sensor histidine kinase
MPIDEMRVPAREGAMASSLQRIATALPFIGRASAAIDHILRRPRPLRTQLLVLTLASALPITAFSGILLWRLHDRERAQFEERLHLTAQDLAGDIDRQLQAMVVTLRTLATSRALLRRDLAEFHAQARESIAGGPFAILLVEPNGQQLLNTRVDFGAPLPLISDLATLSKTIATGRHQVSNLFIGNVSRQPQLNVLMPVVSEGFIRYVLVLAFEPELILGISRQQELPVEWVRGVFDGNMRLISRTQEHDKYVNTQMPESLELRRQTTKVFSATGLNGTPVLRALSPVRNADWVVGATVDQSVVNAAITEASRALAIAGVLLIGSVAMMVLFHSRILSQEIRDLADAAEQLDKGARILTVDGQVSEVNEVRRRLAAAAARRMGHEAERDLLMRELSHRVKNSFAVLQSILNATLRTTTDPKAFAENFKGRLHSMAAAQDILTNSDWHSAELESLARGQLAAYSSPDGARIHFSGPKVLLPSDLAVPVGLVLHELGTNAAKYGALSTPRGRVNLSWLIDDVDGAQNLEIEWREKGGPQVEAPERQGFGSTLIERGLADAKVERVFEPGGVICRISVRLSRADRQN